MLKKILLPIGAPSQLKSNRAKSVLTLTSFCSSPDAWIEVESEEFGL